MASFTPSLCELQFSSWCLRMEPSDSVWASHMYVFSNLSSAQLIVRLGQFLVLGILEYALQTGPLCSHAPRSSSWPTTSNRQSHSYTSRVQERLWPFDWSVAEDKKSCQSYFSAFPRNGTTERARSHSETRSLACADLADSKFSFVPFVTGWSGPLQSGMKSPIEMDTSR